MTGSAALPGRAHPTLLKALVVARRWRTHSTFAREYARAAAGVEESLVRSAPGREQYERWLAGRVKTMPYPHHCQVLEAMFPGHRAEELFAPPPAQPPPVRPPGRTDTRGVCSRPDLDEENMGRRDAPCELGGSRSDMTAGNAVDGSGDQPSGVASRVAGAFGPRPAATDAWGADGWGGDPTDRRQALRTLGGGLLGAAGSAGAAGFGGFGGFGGFQPAEAEALEYTRRAEATFIGRRTIEYLQVVIADLAATFAYTPPSQLLPRALWYRRHVAALLDDGRHTLRERRQLYQCAGWLSVILGWLSYDLGDSRTGEAYCADAWEHGWQAEHGELCAWAMDAAATIAMYDNRPETALQAACKGLAQAPEGSAAAIRVSCQLTRANARLGRADNFEDALRDTRRRLDGLPVHGSGLFCADAGRVASYAATSSVWLERPEPAVTYARQAIDFYQHADTAQRSPTREAIARLDLGIAHAKLGSPDAGVDVAEPALATTRLTGSVLARAGDLDALLGRRFPGSAPARQFHDRYTAMVQQQPKQQITST